MERTHLCVYFCCLIFPAAAWGRALVSFKCLLALGSDGCSEEDAQPALSDEIEEDIVEWSGSCSASQSADVHTESQRKRKQPDLRKRLVFFVEVASLLLDAVRPSCGSVVCDAK